MARCGPIWSAEAVAQLPMRVGANKAISFSPSTAFWRARAPGLFVGGSEVAVGRWFFQISLHKSIATPRTHPNCPSPRPLAHSSNRSEPQLILIHHLAQVPDLNHSRPVAGVLAVDDRLDRPLARLVLQGSQLVLLCVEPCDPRIMRAVEDALRGERGSEGVVKVRW